MKKYIFFKKISYLLFLSFVDISRLDLVFIGPWLLDRHVTLSIRHCILCIINTVNEGGAWSYWRSPLNTPPYIKGNLQNFLPKKRLSFQCYIFCNIIFWSPCIYMCVCVYLTIQETYTIGIYHKVHLNFVLGQTFYFS